MAQQRASTWQAVGAIVAAVATVAAAVVAFQAVEAVKLSRDTALRQVDEDRRDASGLFASTLIIMQNYLKSAEVSSARPSTPVAAGHGFPKLDPDAVYAARELQLLLSLSEQATEMFGRRLGVDLSHVVLYGQAWRGIDFSRVFQYSRYLDLRGANLQGARWGNSDLRGSYLQCADLRAAVFGLVKPGGDFQNSNLSLVDLRGANLAGAKLHADLTNARLDGANLDGTDFTNANLNGVDLGVAVNAHRAIGLDRANHYKPPAAARSQAAYDDNQQHCLENPGYWADLPPSPAAANPDG